MRRTSNLLLLALFCLALPIHLYAGDDDSKKKDDYEWKTWRTRRSHAGFNGHGSFFYQVQTFESKDLDNAAQAMGLDKFDGLLMGWGGYGLGHIGDGWRIGGGGFGLEAKTSGIYHDAATNTNYNQQILMTMGGGGFIVEYSPWMIGPVNFGVGSMIGGGGASIELRRDSGTFDWSDLVNQYAGNPASAENVTTEIMRGFFLLQPYATVRVHVLDWMAVEGTAGYNINTLNRNGWTFGTTELSGKGPDISMLRPYFRVGMCFGG